jgi:hypothetical protein
VLKITFLIGGSYYAQINADFRYTFADCVKELDAGFLLVGKIDKGRDYNIINDVINKVNLLHYIFVVYYHF